MCSWRGKEKVNFGVATGSSQVVEVEGTAWFCMGRAEVATGLW